MKRFVESRVIEQDVFHPALSSRRIQRLLKSDVRYRFVVDLASLKER